jgi:di/tricarboxylate transporter
MHMTPALWALGVVVAAALLIMVRRWRADLIALLVLACLGLTGLVKPDELFTGFSSSAVLTILAVSIISEGLRQAGVTRQIGRLVSQMGKQDERRLILAVMVVSAFISLFMNNIAVIAVMLPAVTSLSRRSQVKPSRLLLPLSIGTLLGGMATLLTTSNIIVSGSLKDAGLRSFGLLDFLPIGLPAIILGTAYMVFLGRRFLPNRFPAGETARYPRIQAELEALYGIDKNLVCLSVEPGSPLANKTLSEAGWMPQLGVQVLSVKRGGQYYFAPRPEECIQEHDLVMVNGQPEGDVLRRFGLERQAIPEDISSIYDENVTLAELVIVPHNKFEGKSLREVQFREKYGFNVLSIWREGHPIQEKVREIPLRYGDTLLIQGPANRLPLLRLERDFILLDEDADVVLKPGKAFLASGITLITLGVAASGYFPVALASLVGAACLLLANCLSMDNAYRAVEWRVIFLIAGLWPLNLAISSTGLATQSVQVILTLLGHLSPLVFAGLLIGIALLVTLLLGGWIAALLLAPLAVSAGQILGTDPRSMAMALALGCSLAFITPYSHPINLMIMSSGGYTSRDFLKAGIPMTLLVGLIILLGLHYFWKL